MQNTPDANAMEAYRRQMLEMYRQATSSFPAVTAEDNWLDSRYPAPDIERDKAAVVLPSSPSVPAPQPEPTPPPQSEPEPEPEPQPQPTPPPDTSTFVGYLRVYAFTGGGAEPVVGARVIVTRPDGDGQTVYANLTTDRDGFTPVIALPSVDPALTLRPGTVQPYVTYTVRVTADGFRPVEHNNIPVYGNNYVTQPVTMIPILPGGDADNTQEFTSGGPANL